MTNGTCFGSYRRIAATAALALGLMAQTVLAAEPDEINSAAANAEQTAAVQAPVQRSADIEPMLCTYPAACIVNHTTDGWLLDYGGPGFHFEAAPDE